VVNVDAFKAAARAAIVIPSVFAFASTVIGRPQVSLFAAFGSFALLVLVEFGGPWRARLAAHAGFAAAGAGLIALGTLCSRDSWLAAGTMAVVAFVILFSGGFSGYLAAAANGAMLLFVLPANVPAPNSAIPDRLLGWALAAGVGTTAVLLLWPPRRRAGLRRAAAGAVRSVIELIEADTTELDGRTEAAREKSRGLAAGFLGSQHRPAGPTDATAALAALPDELDWLLLFLAPPDEEGALRPGSDTEAEALAQAVAVLRASADRLDGGGATADFDGLDRAQHDLVVSLKDGLSDLTWGDDRSALPPELVQAFRVRAAAAGARQLAVQAMGATAGNLPPDPYSEAPAHPSLMAVEQLASEHATVRSVWLQNSLRGAAALAIAVFVAQRTGVQHGFWIVLGTLSVLRSNALGTGWSILTALAGTAAGIVVGAAIVVGIGTHHGALWAVLPLAVLLASYAPRAISFAAGQAGFTVVLLVLFNLIQPVGWSVGVIRIEDVAIGFAVSLGVGLLFWPRGAAATLNSNLAEAYAREADYVAATLHELLGRGQPETTSARPSAAAVDASIHRLDDAFRQYLVERSATGTNVEDIAALVNGATRVRRVAQSLVALSATPDPTTLRRCGEHLDPEVDSMRAWFVALGYAIADHGDVTAPHLRDGDGRRTLFECARAAAAGDAPAKRASLTLLWAVEHPEVLRRLEAHLAARAAAANAAAQPDAARLRFRLAS
jgi:uncharacterized membrane protein YccC